jgi:hypothetical protein
MGQRGRRAAVWRLRLLLRPQRVSQHGQRPSLRLGRLLGRGFRPGQRSQRLSQEACMTRVPCVSCCKRCNAKSRCNTRSPSLGAPASLLAHLPSGFATPEVLSTQVWRTMHDRPKSYFSLSPVMLGSRIEKGAVPTVLSPPAPRQGKERWRRVDPLRTGSSFLPPRPSPAPPAWPRSGTPAAACFPAGRGCRRIPSSRKS